LNGRRFGVTIRKPSLRSPSLHTEAAGAAPPDAFGPFRVLHQIGAGTWGPVFRAYDAERERLVAVKLFKVDLAPDRVHQLVEEFKRLIAADLSHPAIAAPLATGIVRSSVYLAHEYVAAESLDLAIREYGPAPPGDALRVVTQLAGALDFAAAVDIQHGALHPRDVLLSSDETRLTGLGIARAFDRQGVAVPVRCPYTPPEVIAGARWDRRADVFGLAALIYELLTGRRITGTGAQTAEDLEALTGRDGSTLGTAFARALSDDPTERYESALGFVDAVRKALPGVTFTPTPVAPSSRRGSRRDLEPTLPLDEPDRIAPRPEFDIASVFSRGDGVDSPPGPQPAPSAGSVQGDAQPAPAVGRVGTSPQPSLTIDPADLDVRLAPDAAFDLRVAEDARYADVEVAPASVEPPAVEKPERLAAAGSISSSEQVPLSTPERLRSAVWPLVAALGIGIALGFAGGYGVGVRDRTPAAGAATTATPTGKEYTEGAVGEPSKPSGDARFEPGTSQTGRGVPVQRDKNADAGRPPLESTPEESGRLLVRSTPAGARVLVDGKEAGVTPVAIRDLARGAHRVRITRDGYDSEERRVVITRSRPAQSMTVALVRPRGPDLRGTPAPATPATMGRYTGALSVDSRPLGAKVYLDGRLIGTTPVAVTVVAAGEHAIRLERDGYRRWSSSVRIVANESNRVTASLER
jgi:serine/threonine protein kinase